MGFETRWLAGNWWNLAYPAEVEILSEGPQWGRSFASEIWLAQVNDLIRAFIAHLREVALYDRIIGFQIGAGSSGKWIKDTSCMLRPTMDFSSACYISRAMPRRLRAWLDDGDFSP